MDIINIKDIPGYEGAYAITRDGKVWSHKRDCYLKPMVNKKGYHVVQFNIGNLKKEYKIHRLVATAFIPNPDHKPTVDHINRDKSDNRVENLRWSTHKEQNLNRAPGTIQRAMEALSEELSKPVEMRDKYNHNIVIATFRSMSDASLYVTGARGGRKNIGACVNGRRKSAYGYFWCLAEDCLEVTSRGD